MDEKRRKTLLDKIAKALKRRQDRGLTVFQLNQVAKQPTPETNTQMANHRKPVRPATSHRPIMVAGPLKNSTIFLSGSIGDVIALEAFFTEAERAHLARIYYATQKGQEIEEMFKAVPSYPQLKVQKSVWGDFNKFWCFFSKEECISKIKSSMKPIPQELQSARDFSINNVFPDIHAGQRQYTGSSFVKYKVADISNFDLPTSYICICPYSTDKRIVGRDFTDVDWKQCLEYLKKIGLKGVVLNAGNDTIPQSDQLINLSNKTTITEAIEIIKRGSGYVGIDSALSVVAAKVFNSPYLQIKSINQHCCANANCYYAPQTDFRFMVKAINVPTVLPPPQIKIFNAETKRIKLNVAQGVGDIFWVYQKFSPYFDEIDICINQVVGSGHKLQSRAIDFLRILPKVGKITTRMMSGDMYNQCANTQTSMAQIMSRYAAGERDFDYCCNKQLEEGVRLEQIDPSYPIEETVNMYVPPHSLDYDRHKYVTVYVSGGTMIPSVVSMHNLWGVERWSSFIDAVLKKYQINLPVVIIGASYDEEAANGLSKCLEGAGYTTKTVIDSLACNVVGILGNTLLYIGYQSGLNILADNLDTKQIMVYFPMLTKMMYAWCKKGNIDNGTFNAFTFDMSTEDILKGLKLKL